MTTQTTKYETGATTHAVNDLILWVENTRELAEKRDWLYQKCTEYNKQNQSIIGHRTPKYQAKMDKEFLQGQFKYLLHDVIRSYNKSMGQTYSYNGLDIKQRNEFARIYANDFAGWQKEHSIN